MSETLDDITRRRLAIEEARKARQAAKIAESAAAAEACRAPAAATCETSDTLLSSLRASIAKSIGACPLCNLAWNAHAPADRDAHIERVFGPTPSDGVA